MEGKTDMQNAEDNFFQSTPKSSVKLIKNTKGINWEIKVVQGEENLVDDLMKKAVEVHRKLKEAFGG